MGSYTAARNISSLNVKVKQGVFRLAHLVVGLILIGAPGIILLLWQWWFERRRWKNSDHAPSGLGGGDE